MSLPLKISLPAHMMGQILHSIELIFHPAYILAAIATVLTFLGAIFVVWRSVTASDFVVSWVLRRNRNKTICKTLKSFGVPSSKLREKNRHISDIRTRSEEELSVQTEIKWISDLSTEIDPSRKSRLELDGVTDKFPPGFQLHELSKAYESFGKGLRALVLLSSNPIMKDEQELALTMARYLKINANFRSSETKEFDRLTINIPKLKLILEMFTPRLNFSPALHIDHLSVSYKGEQKSVSKLPSRDGSERDGLAKKPIQLNQKETGVLSPNSSSRYFNGVLPALQGHHSQVDPMSGHLRLLLELSEISYSTVQATHYVGTENRPGPTFEELIEKSEGMDRLLTLSMIPVTTDGYLIAAQRSKHVGVGKLKFAPAVGGNLELRDRLGLSVDRDEFGIPDPLSAIVREAREEMGLNIEASEIHILGLDQFSCDEEVKTWVLTTSVQIQNTAEELVEISKRADQVEGAWETTGDFWALPLPRNAQSAEEMIRWAINSQEVAPHLILALLSICLPFLASEKGATIDALQMRIASLWLGVSVPMPKGTRTFGRQWIQITKSPVASQRQINRAPDH